MYYIACTKASKRFEWEVEVLLTNLQSHGIKDIILLFYGEDASIVENIKNKYHVRCHLYPDNRKNKIYIPSSGPYLWMKFLTEFPEMQKENYFYIDTDIILRDKINFDSMSVGKDKWYASDCSSYLQPSFVESFGEAYLNGLCQVIGVDKQRAIEKFESCAGGAQWYISQPIVEFWEKVYEDSTKLYMLFVKLEYLYKDVKNAKRPRDTFPCWTAGMWSLLWNTLYFDIDVCIEKELSFSWSTQDIKEWMKHKILHNAGVFDSKKGLFFKGDWVNESPIGADIQVDQTKCTKYLSNLLVIQVFGAYMPMNKKLDELQKLEFHATMKRKYFSGFGTVGFSLIYEFGFLCMIFWGAYQISQSNLTLGSLVALTQISGQIQGPIANLTGMIPYSFGVLESINRIIQVERLEEKASKKYLKKDLAVFKRINVRGLNYA